MHTRGYEHTHVDGHMPTCTHPAAAGHLGIAQNNQLWLEKRLGRGGKMAEGRACVERLLHRDACGGPPKRRPRGSGLWFQLHHSVAVNFFVVSPVQGLVLFCFLGFFFGHILWHVGS